MADEESVQISEADVKDFAQRLQTWGHILPPKDRALLQMLLTRSEGGAEVAGYSMDSIESATMGALGPMVKSGVMARVPRAWIQLGDPWVQTVTK